MRPLAQTNGHDPPRLVDELVPCLAAVVDEIVVGLKTRFESQLSRMNCQMFSTGLSSGDFGGMGRIVMLAGMTNLADRCHPA